MNQHATDYLAAYFDGEVSGAQRNKVEEHLESCPICQLELKKLQGLSSLLKACPPMIAHTSPDQFAAQVGLRLPRTTAVQTGERWQRAIDIGWMAIPMTIISGWVIIQTLLLTISSLQGLGFDLGWPTWILSLIRQINAYTIWGQITTDLWNQLVTTIPWLEFGEKLVRVFAPSLLVTATTGIVFSCWIVCWWVLQQQRRFSRTFYPKF